MAGRAATEEQKRKHAPRRDKMAVPRWWVGEGADADGSKLASRIVSTASYLYNEDGPRRDVWNRRGAMYMGDPTRQICEKTPEAKLDIHERHLRHNVCRNAIDATHNRIAKQKPVPQPLTEGGTYALQKQAQMLGGFIQGVIHREGVHEKAANQLRNAMSLSDGYLKVFGAVQGKMGCIRVEPVLPWALLVDPVDAYHGRPRSFFERRLVDRSALYEMFVDNDQTITDAERKRRAKVIADAPTQYDAAKETLSDRVCVWEAHRTASYDGAEDGLHAIVVAGPGATGGGCLYQRAYTRTRAPYAHITWKKPIVGWHGHSLTEEIAPVQHELNDVAQSIQQIIYHQGGPKLLFEDGTIDADQHWDNSLKLSLIKVTPGAAMPVMFAPNPVSPQYFQHLDRLKQASYEDVGVSELSATSRKPAGLESGKALQTYSDIETERFVLVGQAYERFIVTLGELIVEAAQELDAAKIPVEVTHERRRRRRRQLERIRWKDIDLKRDAYELKVFPVSSLPQTPPGKLATVEQMMGAGLISRQMGLYLLDFPDLEAAMQLELAPYELALDYVEKMLDEGKPMEPLPFMDPAVTLTVMQNALARAVLDEAPDDRIELLSDFLQAFEQMMNPPPSLEEQAMAEAAAMEAEAGAAGQLPALDAPPAIENAGPAGAALPTGAAMPAI